MQIIYTSVLSAIWFLAGYGHYKATAGGKVNKMFYTYKHEHLVCFPTSKCPLKAVYLLAHNLAIWVLDE